MALQTRQATIAEQDTHGYLAELDSRILKAADCAGANLRTVSGEAGGAFPSVVADRLAIHGQRLPDDANAPGRHEGGPPGPELHAAEFEWYFAADCVKDLADMFRPRHGEALLLGAPTVAAELSRHGRRPTTVDRSPFLRDRFGSKLGDLHPAELREPLGFLHSHPVVFFDAPWHEDHISRWLWQASLAVHRGGSIAFALFGELTRPAAREERARLLESAESLGRTSVLEDALSYRTPLFEAEALAAAGHDLRSSWRRGDLVLIEDVSRPMRVPPPPVEREWMTVLDGDRVVKLDQHLRAKAAAVAWDDLPKLDTVSRSRIRRLGIDLWSSRNEFSTRRFVQGRQGKTASSIGQ